MKNVGTCGLKTRKTTNNEMREGGDFFFFAILCAISKWRVRAKVSRTVSRVESSRVCSTALYCTWDVTCHQPRKYNAVPKLRPEYHIQRTNGTRGKKSRAETLGGSSSGGSRFNLYDVRPRVCARTRQSFPGGLVTALID